MRGKTNSNRGARFGGSLDGDSSALSLRDVAGVQIDATGGAVLPALVAEAPALVATSPALCTAVVAVPVVPGTCVSHSASVITVLLRYEHHIDHTFLQATHYQDQDGVLTIYRGQDEVARFTAGSWDGVYRYARNRVREPDGGERTAKGLEVELGEGSDGAQ